MLDSDSMPEMRCGRLDDAKYEKCAGALEQGMAHQRDRSLKYCFMNERYPRVSREQQWFEDMTSMQADEKDPLRSPRLNSGIHGLSTSGLKSGNSDALADLRWLIEQGKPLMLAVREFGKCAHESYFASVVFYVKPDGSGLIAKNRYDRPHTLFDSIGNLIGGLRQNGMRIERFGGGRPAKGNRRDAVRKLCQLGYAFAMISTLPGNVENVAAEIFGSLDEISAAI